MPEARVHKTICTDFSDIAGEEYQINTRKNNRIPTLSFLIIFYSLHSGIKKSYQNNVMSLLSYVEIVCIMIFAITFRKWIVNGIIYFNLD
jgi:hypothetical protein